LAAVTSLLVALHAVRSEVHAQDGTTYSAQRVVPSCASTKLGSESAFPPEAPSYPQASPRNEAQAPERTSCPPSATLVHGRAARARSLPCGIAPSTGKTRQATPLASEASGTECGACWTRSARGTGRCPGSGSCGCTHSSPPWPATRRPRGPAAGGPRRCMPPRGW